MSSAGDKKVYLKAGQQNMPVRASGDFIFLKEASRDVIVHVDGQPIQMRRGAKWVVPRKTAGEQAFKSFDVSNPHDVDLRLVFVVGEGDYNELIVTGELSLSESIQTNALGTNKLPTLIRKTIGLESSNDFEVFKNAKLWVTEEGGLGAGRIVEYENKLYFLDGTKLYIYDWDGNLELEETIIVSEGSLGKVAGMCVASDGRIYIACEGGLYYLDTYNLVAYRLNNTMLYGGGRGVFEYDGIIYIQVTHTLYEYEMSSGVLTSKPLPYPTNLNIFCLERSHPNFGDIVWLFVSNGGGANTHAYRIGTWEYLGSDSLSSTHICGFLNREKGLYGTLMTTGAVSEDNRFVIRVLEDRKYVGKLWVQDGDDVSTKRIYSLPDLGYEFKRRGDGAVLKGPIIAAVLRGVHVGGNLRDNYLDYVTKLEYFDGNYAYVKSAGSASFAYRGYKDVGELYLGSEVVLGLLPEYLTNAI